METIARKPFQGISNILNFNRHFFLSAIVLVILLAVARRFTSGNVQSLLTAAGLLIVITTFISLTVSYYVYDYSPLYQLHWLNKLNIRRDGVILNLHAGFDETSRLISTQFPKARLIVLDFYEPKKHTELSIKRARKAYPPFEGTVTCQIPGIPLPDNYADCVILFMSAHEIRNAAERRALFAALKCKLKAGGKIAVVEHLRDLPNLLAYNIGSFHFYSAASWRKVFRDAGMSISNQFKVTPFITAFILENNATPS
jgi:hypothetical protein